MGKIDKMITAQAAGDPYNWDNQANIWSANVAP